MLAAFFVAFFGAVAFGQSSGTAQDFGYLASVDWKSNPDLNVTLVQERSKMDVSLSEPSLQSSDRALFLAYQRLLDYVMADIQASVPLEKSIPANYEKVVTEAETDQDLKDMPSGVLATYLPGLIEALQTVPTPIAH